jgi:hypothetical protein
MKLLPKNKILGAIAGGLVACVLGATAAIAVTTIGTNIDTDGDLTVGGDITLSDGSTITTGVVDGTTLYSIAIAPVSSTGATQRNKLVYIGANFEATAFFSYGLVLGFSRESGAATAAFDGKDTGLDLRVTNEMANDVAYGIQGAFIKAKNINGAVVGLLRGLNVEVSSPTGSATTDLVGQEIAVESDGGTAVTKALGLKFRKSSGITAGGYFTDIQLQNGAIIAGGAGTDDASITTQVGDTAVNGLYLASDGKVWFLNAGTDTWTQLTIP